MVNRTFWAQKIEEGWRKRSLVWLAGVRRVGKTTLCRSLPDISYFDCELPRARQHMEDPEAFLGGQKGRVVLDEIHRLPDPAELLKIATDHFPRLRVIATGSSTLEATARFRDKLTGRKVSLHLTPMTSRDLADFALPDLSRRMLHGGLPPFFLADRSDPAAFAEWLDSYWAKDIQELFRVERRSSFLRFVELVLSRSGGMFEANAFARPCEVSRPTISNYLGVLEAASLAHVVKPFSSNPTVEIVSAPKVYGFDSGFVCYARGWSELRKEDRGILWEHLVLNELKAGMQSVPIRYWRDKRGHEVDFVLPGRGKTPTAIECKWSSREPDLRGLAAFRRRYPHGPNLVVSSDVERPFAGKVDGLQVRFVGLPGLLEEVAGV